MGNNWKQIPLGKLISLQRGHDLPSQDRVDGQIPIMGSSGLTGWHNVSKCDGPGVVIGRSGNSMGVVSYSESDFWPLNTCLYVTDFKGNDERYIYYMLQQIDFEQFNSGSAQKSLNRNSVYPYEVTATTDVNEQKRIGRLLANFEKKISINHQINQTLEQMAQTLFKSWFVDFDPVVDNALDAGFFELELDLSEELLRRADVRRTIRTQAGFKPLPAATRQLFPAAFEPCDEPSLGLGGWVPKGWSVSTTGNELTVKGGSTPSTTNPEFWEGGDIHWTSPKDLSGNPDKVLLTTERKITATGLDKITSGLLPPETVLMSSRAPVGYLAITKIPTAINQGYIAVTNSKHLSQEFVLYWLDSNIDMIKSLSGGTTFAEISKKTFRTISIIVPSQKTIDLASHIIRSNLDKISANSEECRQLEKLRDYLRPKLISGELEVNS
ncbi:restriction endonuclease subunit S [Aeromonas hydrophila]|uniref:restriction endonuclease subunit S n=1 Tax=Aeromonas hydrophila TaxID=644 RepID=UPI001118780D|nr:restriction endonuclease subunit S [Aeromonas hydrophila]TNJ19429.1 restriction endonuclease subunit S [Aeromonas hydrophila]